MLLSSFLSLFLFYQFFGFDFTSAILELLNLGYWRIFYFLFFQVFGFDFVGFWCWRCVCRLDFVQCVNCFGFLCVLYFVWLGRKCGKMESIGVLNEGVLIIGAQLWVT